MSVASGAPAAGAPHVRFWPRGVARELWIPQTTLPECLDVAARRFPDKPAIVYCGAVTTYAQLKRQVDLVAAYLQHKAGVQPGDRVLLASQNCPQFVIAFYAILRTRAVVVPANPMSKAQEVRHYRDDSGARVAFVAQELLPAFEGLQLTVVHAYSDAVAPGCPDALPDWVTEPLRPVTGPGCVGWDAMEAAAGPLAGQAGQPGELAMLPYTSGTTGQPKGCMHTHATVLASLAWSSAR